MWAPAAPTSRWRSCRRAEARVGRCGWSGWTAAPRCSPPPRSPTRPSRRPTGSSSTLGDGRSLPYPDGSFDVVHASLVAPSPRRRRGAVALVAGDGARRAARDRRQRPATGAGCHWIGAWLLGHLLTRNRYTRHDAPAVGPARLSRGWRCVAMLAAADLAPIRTSSGAPRASVRDRGGPDPDPDGPDRRRGHGWPRRHAPGRASWSSAVGRRVPRWPRLARSGHEVLVLLERSPAWRWRAGGVFAPRRGAWRCAAPGLDARRRSRASPGRSPRCGSRPPRGTTFRLTYGAEARWRDGGRLRPVGARPGAARRSRAEAGAGRPSASR